MNTKFQLSAKGWVAVGFVVILYVAVAFTSRDPVAIFFYALVAMSSAGIAAFDSMQIHLRQYRTWISYGPVGLFLVCALFWPVAIVWYFVVRVRIARGTMPLRDEFRERHVVA